MQPQAVYPAKATYGKVAIARMLLLSEPIGRDSGRCEAMQEAIHSGLNSRLSFLIILKSLYRQANFLASSQKNLCLRTRYTPINPGFTDIAISADIEGQRPLSLLSFVVRNPKLSFSRRNVKFKEHVRLLY